MSVINHLMNRLMANAKKPRLVLPPDVGQRKIVSFTANANEQKVLFLYFRSPPDVGQRKVDSFTANANEQVNGKCQET
ncbi:hypothetical protein Tco_1231780 [Tanacetum coccineum]